MTHLRRLLPVLLAVLALGAVLALLVCHGPQPGPVPVQSPAAVVTAAPSPHPSLRPAPPYRPPTMPPTPLQAGKG